MPEGEEVGEYGVDVSEGRVGGVLKKVVKEGQGEGHPGKGDTVFVHYVGTLADTGDKFDSSRDRGEEFSFTIGRGQVIKGWDQGVASMKKGELAILRCAPDFAYGAAGSPPKIPPDATLNFEVELFRWEGEDISPEKDKSITRSVQQEGEKYDNPNEGALVEVDVDVLVKGASVWKKSAKYSLGEGSEEGLPDGVDRALKRFKSGEKSLLHLHAKWGYGKNPPVPSIPPNSPLDIVVHLTKFEKAKDTWQMTDDEKLEASEELKTRGTAFFQAGKIKLAVTKYTRIMDLLEHVTSLEGEKKERRNQVYLAARLNAALCYLKKNEYLEAVKQCDKVLSDDPNNIKGLYRRGQAYFLQNDFEKAMADNINVVQLEPGNKAALVQVQHCKAKLAEIRNKEKKTFANMFDKFAAHDEKRKTEDDERKRAKAFPNGTTESEGENTTTETVCETKSVEKVETNSPQKDVTA